MQLKLILFILMMIPFLSFGQKSQLKRTVASNPDRIGRYHLVFDKPADKNKVDSWLTENGYVRLDSKTKQAQKFGDVYSGYSEITFLSEENFIKLQKAQREREAQLAEQRRREKQENFIIGAAVVLGTIAVIDKASSSSNNKITKPSFKSIKIGKQEWMAENLNISTQQGSWCRSCDQNGRLYNWETAKNVCPEGWRLPNDKDWDILVDYLGGASIAGLKLKSRYSWKFDGQGSNSSGFNGLPAGIIDEYGSFAQSGIAGIWWSYNQYNIKEANVRSLTIKSNRMEKEKSDKRRGHSVRCIKR